MGKSRRKNPIIVVGSDSEKHDKRVNNRKLRRKCKSIIKNCEDYDFLNLPEMEEISDVWDMAKDGKIYDSELDIKYMRK